MGVMRFELDVELDGGQTHRVVADQRDIAKFEVQDFGWPIVRIEENASMGFFRFLAWSSMTRQQLTTLTWPAFDAVLVEAMPADEEDADAADADNPGKPAPPATPTSRSRTRRGGA